ncbi:hypothetical protein DPMN_040275 [Dreissena polymorpha]|uniref:Uncharacterized protein n=1 Tax=Dreissena polymorpha TaxID=45954 RepID=A0A9D4HV54_DREPO|nr:hypothetical protein DPMN_040275 [Dreissena polymorpha]
MSTCRIVQEACPHTSTWPAGVTCTPIGHFNSGSVKVARTDPSLAKVRSLCLWEFVTYKLSPVGLNAQCATAKQKT